MVITSCSGFNSQQLFLVFYLLFDYYFDYSYNTYVGGLYGYWHSVPARIAVNMIICCASGGTTAVLFASWAQVCKYSFVSYFA